MGALEPYIWVLGPLYSPHISPIIWVLGPLGWVWGCQVVVHGRRSQEFGFKVTATGRSAPFEEQSQTRIGINGLEDNSSKMRGESRQIRPNPKHLPPLRISGFEVIPPDGKSPESAAGINYPHGTACLQPI